MSGQSGVCPLLLLGAICLQAVVDLLSPWFSKEDGLVEVCVLTRSLPAAPNTSTSPGALVTTTPEEVRVTNARNTCPGHTQ